MSSEGALTVFRATRPFFSPFLQRGSPLYHGADKRIAGFDSTAHYLSRGSSVELANRNWRTVTREAEDFGVDELYENLSSKKQ